MSCASLRIYAGLAFTVFLTIAAPRPVGAEEKTPAPSVADGIEPVVVDEPAFPAPLPKDRVRIWSGGFFAPPADVGDTDLGLIRSELRVRGRIPVDEVASIQVSGDFRVSSYDTDGGTLFRDCADCPSPGDLYSAVLAVQGGYLLNRGWHWFRDDENWAILGALYGRARWEPGAFEESLTPGLDFGIGYQLPSRLRIAVTGRVERALDGDGVKFAPSGYVSWDITSKTRVRNRGLGLLLEHRPTRRYEVFATAFQTSDRFRLDDRPGLSSGPTFSDHQVLVGGGLVFKVTREFRVTFETGAIVDRRVAVYTRDDDRLDSSGGDVSPYFSLRGEFRP